MSHLIQTTNLSRRQAPQKKTRLLTFLLSSCLCWCVTLVSMIFALWANQSELNILSLSVFTKSPSSFYSMLYILIERKKKISLWPSSLVSVCCIWTIKHFLNMNQVVCTPFCSSASSVLWLLSLMSFVWQFHYLCSMWSFHITVWSFFDFVLLSFPSLSCYLQAYNSEWGLFSFNRIK